MPALIPQILSFGTATPDLYLTQEEVFEFYTRHDLMPEAQKPLYERLLLGGPIKGRFFALQDPVEILNESPDSQIQRFSKQARKIASRACRRAMSDAGLSPGDIGGIVVNTCTGYLCPGLTSYLAGDLGLESDIKAIDILGMGCGSAIPNLECGCGMLFSSHGKPVLCASVEICSATHLVDDDPGLTVSNCIFGDGAAAVVLGNEPAGGDGLSLMDFETGLFPEYREALRYRNQHGHLRNTLSGRVPPIVARCLEKVTGKLLTRNNLEIPDIQWWAVHAGGTQILDRVAGRFGLPADRLVASRRVFEQYGNMSSPTVFFVLNDLMQRRRTGGPGLLLAFGAGFTAFAALASGEKT